VIEECLWEGWQLFDLVLAYVANNPAQWRPVIDESRLENLGEELLGSSTDFQTIGDQLRGGVLVFPTIYHRTEQGYEFQASWVGGNLELCDRCQLAQKG
jgi:hypothetical protein